MKQYGFRHRILLLAVALVVATQLVMLFPVLDLIKRDSAEQAERTVGLAGVLFDEYMHNREERLLTTVNLLVSDYPFKQAVASTRRRSDDSLRAAQPREPRRGERRGIARSRRQRSRSARRPTGVPCRRFPSVPFDSLEEGTRHRVIGVGGVAVSDRHGAAARTRSARVGHARVSDRRCAGGATEGPHRPRRVVRIHAAASRRGS